MAWINIKTYHPPMRGAAFQISLKIFFADGIPVDAIRSTEDNPDLMADLCLRTIVEARPELEGAMVMSYNYDVAKQCMVVVVLHDTLPKVGMYEEFPVERLTPVAA